jgi:hypothetical protein
VAVNGDTRNVTEVQASNSTAKDSTADATATAPPAPPPPEPPTTLTDTFAGATLTATRGFGRIYIKIILPSGEKIINAAGWGDEQWNREIARAVDADVGALTSLKASWDVLYGQYKAKLLPNG